MNDSISASAWAIRREQAQMLLNSGFLPEAFQRAEQVIAIMMYGDVLGIPPMAALNGISVIRNKPTVSPQLMLALARRAGVLEDIQVTDDGHTCTVVVKRVGQSAHTATFGEADAVAMELAPKNNWKKQPAVMRQWRAVAAACRIVFPDIIMGFYTPDEMGADLAINDEGDMQIVAPPIAVDPNAESKRIASEWAARWKADGATGADMQAALGVKRLGEFDWLTDGAVAKADGLMESHAIDHADEALDSEEEKAESEDAPKAPTAAELTMENFEARWIGVGANADYAGLGGDDLLMILGIEKLNEYDWWQKNAAAKADKLATAYVEKRSETAIKHAASMAVASKGVSHLPENIGKTDTGKVTKQSELETAFPRGYNKNTDGARL